jgi:hypothetical protein
LPWFAHRDANVEEPRFERVGAQPLDAGARRDSPGEFGGRDPVVGALRGSLRRARTVPVRTPLVAGSGLVTARTDAPERPFLAGEVGTGRLRRRTSRAAEVARA